MAKEKTTVSRAQALSSAKQQHLIVQEFLNQEPVRTDLLEGLIENKGDGNELRVLKKLLDVKNTISGNDMSRGCGMHLSTVSNAAKELNEYLEKVFSNALEPLKAKRIKICIWRNEGRGGLSIGYHFFCFNNKTKKYLDVPATKNLFANLWNEFIENRLRKKLEQEAKEQLLEKLDDYEDYQPLSVETGRIVDISEQDVFDKSLQFGKLKRCDHNRVWKAYDINSLLKSRDLFVLSVDAGRGKTTFLRHLQIEYLQKTEFLPIFLNASEIEEWELEDSNQLIRKFAKKFGIKKYENKVIDFFKGSFGEKIVFLIDGLDQIKAGGNEYEHFVDHVVDLMGKKLIIASRPSAVISLEDEKEYSFLRLRSFDVNAQIKYFGENYKRAQQLSMYASELISVPMLAYMLRLLIRDKQDENIKTRTELYRRFIYHILVEYKHGKNRLDSDARTQMRYSLGEISYTALAKKNPYIQSVPLEVVYTSSTFPDVLNGRRGEFLSKSGLVNLIIDRSEWEGKDSLFFTHQSFQEYLAAEYVSQNDELIQLVLSKKWNPKWDGVIKFLAGIKGQKIIELILLEKDNPIHSKLFLSAELVPETEVRPELKKFIWEKLEKLSVDPVFAEKAWGHKAYINETEIVNKLVAKFNSKDAESRIFATSVLKELKDRVNNDVVDKLVREAEIEEKKLRSALPDNSKQFDKKIDNKAAQEIIDRLEAKNGSASPAEIDSLVYFKDKVDDEFVSRVADKLENENHRVRSSALRALALFHDRVDDIGIVAKIIEMLEDENAVVRITAMTVIWEFMNKINNDLIKKIIPVKSGMALIVLGDFYRRGQLEFIERQ